MEDLQRLNLLSAWFLKTQEIQKIKEPLSQLEEDEKTLRQQVHDNFFPDKLEGTTTFPLQGGWALKAVYALDRKVDEAAWPAVKAKLKEIKEKPDLLVRMKPALDTRKYKELMLRNKDAADILEQALVTKPKLPTLSMVEPPKPEALQVTEESSDE